jgi:hypothetical protein
MQHAYLAEHFDEYVLHDVTKGVNEPQFTEEQLEAYNLFTIQAFDKAIPSLKTLWTQEQDTLALFYLIAAYIGTGQKDEAQIILADAKNNLSPQQQALIDRLIE